MNNYTLNNETQIQEIGFGTWQIPNGQEAYNSVKWALEAGYRHIDTAYVYGNEESVGKAIKDSGIPREEIFVTTKLSAQVKDASEVRKYFEESLTNLGLDYVDCYLIHNARPWKDAKEGYDYFKENVAVWAEMEKIYDEGLTRSIGVSNFLVKDLENLLEHSIVIPVMNQIKYHPGYTQDDVVEFCKNHQILVEAYSPFATGKLFDNPVLVSIANKYKKTQAQVIVKWVLQQGHLPLPKSVTKERIESNIQDLDFELDEQDVQLLNTLSF